VGAEQAIQIDARVVAATHRDLDDDLAARRFRQDLLFRLNVHVLRVPPLRDRRADIPALVHHFLASICARFGFRPKAIDDDVVRRLAAAEWRRNNVRELRNVVERLIIAAGDDDIRLEHLPAELLDGDAAAGADSSLAALRADAERRIVTEALDRNDWHITRTAEQLGLADHASLLKVMRRLGVRRD
jgi:two-component system, NtrC family, nitrogen regulation response regulator NtrX